LGATTDVQRGFRRDTGRFVEIHDDLGVTEPRNWPSSYDGSVSTGPSVVAVGKMLAFFMRDVRGGIAECNAALPGYEDHKWQKYWNILPSRW
jgi:hypothetical protein